MISNRSVLFTFLAISFIAIILLGFSDKLNPKCNPNQIQCARAGGSR